MAGLRGRLPPLDFLVAFEAAARRLNFTAAAAELNVTQAAVSRQIRILEDYLGVKLFERRHRAVSLTPEGLEFQHTVALALTHIANASSELKARSGGAKLTVATDQSIATLWLVPRLPGFRKRQPDISVRLIASDNEADCLSKDVDVAIIYGREAWPGFAARRLLDEEVYPVCSPAFLTGAGPLDSPRDLARLALLDLEDDHWNWINWRVWFTEQGLDLPREHHSLQINSYPLLIQSACDGLGVALGWRHLVDSYLDSGRLVRPVAATLRTAHAYHVVWPDDRQLTDDARAFCAWVLAESGV